MPDQPALAAFLRARRDLLKPADVGLDPRAGRRRRVAGLRREEVAALADISTEYYLRLEQGRERQPSDQVLERLARALQLSDDATEYMRSLARPGPRRRRQCTSGKTADPGIQAMIDSWHLTPAYVTSRDLTILNSNPMARALMPCFAPGCNEVRCMFLTPELRSWIRNWDEVAELLASWLRFNMGEEDAVDSEMRSLIDELSLASRPFQTLWARQGVKRKSSGLALFDHPHVGPLDLRYRVCLLPDKQQALVTYYAEPGTRSEESLRSLSRFAASPAPQPF